MKTFTSMLFNRVLVMGILAALAFPAMASDMYVSASVGSATQASVGTSDITASGTSYKAMLGYNVNQYLATEVGYTSLLSSAALKGSPSGLTASQSFAGTQTVNGYEAAILGQFPITNNLSALVRVGYASMKASSSASITGTGYVVNIDKPSATASGATYGLGAKYSINKSFDVRAGYNIYNLTGTASQNQVTVVGGVPGATTTTTGQDGNHFLTEIYVAGAYHF